ncbi:MAG TPA: peptidoglycan DD-metalloendopeptidase family protein [Sporosarcina sp.]|nr:peptidoglycan DD-metalloendopeptidase family protein [Sporosarcina sp.]
MRTKLKWLLAIVLLMSVLIISSLEKRQLISTSIGEVFSSGEDFIVMRKWIASFIDEERQTVPVHFTGNTITSYESVQPFQDGVMISYPTAINVQAEKNGLVIFTGITRKTGKTVTVLYDDGDEVTYGFVGSFSKMPYTSVKAGDTLASLDEQTMFFKVKRDGQYMEPSELATYLLGIEP